MIPFSKLVQLIDLLSYLRAMQRSFENEALDNSQYINYQYCPWWALANFRGRPVSLTGKVVFVQDNYIILELDTQQKKELKVNVIPYEFKYCFSDGQFKRLKSNKEYRLLFESTKTQPMATYSVNNELRSKLKLDEGIDQSSSQDRQVAKLINAHSFKLGSFVQVRGRCNNQNVLNLQSFTQMDENFDLANYNRMLQVIIQRMQRFYY